MRLIFTFTFTGSICSGGICEWEGIEEHNELDEHEDDGDDHQQEAEDHDEVEVDFYIESIEEVSVVEESVSEKEMEEHDEQVENFAEDEPAKIYVVPENKQISFFEMLWNKGKS